ncbi:MAG: hypothetical protein LBI67_04485 [Treponema sp.]|jgi:hypothetical protein|nr:hypothetical protein [Treponema sp.]
MSDEQKEQVAPEAEQGKEDKPEPEKEQQIDFGTELPNPFKATNSEDGSKKPQW